MLTSDAGSSGVSGDITIVTGTSSGGKSGSITLSSGAARDAQAGDISIFVGNGDQNSGGSIYLTAGLSSAEAESGGRVVIQGGEGANTQVIFS
jgi:hypothetical protein